MRVSEFVTHFVGSDKGAKGLFSYDISYRALQNTVSGDLTPLLIEGYADLGEFTNLPTTPLVLKKTGLHSVLHQSDWSFECACTITSSDVYSSQYDIVANRSGVGAALQVPDSVNELVDMKVDVTMISTAQNYIKVNGFTQLVNIRYTSFDPNADNPKGSMHRSQIPASVQMYECEGKNGKSVMKGSTVIPLRLSLAINRDSVPVVPEKEKTDMTYGGWCRVNTNAASISLVGDMLQEHTEDTFSTGLISHDFMSNVEFLAIPRDFSIIKGIRYV